MADAQTVASLEAAQAAVTRQGDEVRALKAAKKDGNAEQSQIDEAIAKLKDLKIDLDKLVKAAGDSGGQSKEEFRNAMNNALERRMFYVPAFKIYGGVAGLYDFGPPGTAVKSNLLAFWRQHFVLTENMLEVECPSVTPEVVLKASGHVDRFTDLMVNDVVTNDCHRADHLLKDFLEPMLEDPMLAADKRAEILDDITRVDEFSPAELGARLKSYGVKAPDTKNDITEPYPFNLMFATSIGPSGQQRGFLRPETAQGIFVNFRDLLYYNGGKLPFAGAQIGQAFRNEIAPRAGLLRVREFTLAEIEHFVNPDDKSCPAKFATVADLEFQFYGRTEQLGSEKKPVVLRLGDAVSSGKVANETLGYFIGRTYIFLTTIGIDPSRLRFRQHLQHEMAHYACDCWDAEIECSYGWMECVGLADRSAYDLKAHTDKSGTDLVAYEKFPEPREMDVVEVTPIKKVMGKELKKDAKIVCEALEAMEEGEAMEFKAKLEADGAAPLTICTTGQEFSITQEMVTIEKKTKKVSGRNFTPSVIEPSFGIGRIIYCMWEHAFYMRDGDEQRAVFRFSPVIAPIKCTVFPLTTDDRFASTVAEVSGALTRAGLSNKVDSTGTSIGKRYARTDEIGVPFAVTVDHTSLEDGTVTIRERDTTGQVRMPRGEVAEVIRKICDVQMSWEDVTKQYPAVAVADA